MTYTLYHGDCLDILPTLEAGSVDAVIADPPYGTTACKWDSVIPFEPMWAGIKHVIRERAAVVLFGSEPFSSLLRVSNLDWYKYDWVWTKSNGGGFLLANKMPLKRHELISIFNSGRVYNPQFSKGRKYRATRGAAGGHIAIPGTEKDRRISGWQTVNTGWRYPTSIIHMPNDTGLHPTQKPVALMEYLIKTYTNEGDTVLDFTMGSGTTGVACMRTGRNFIGIELDADYFRIAEQRIANAAGDIMLTDKERESGARMLPLF